MRKLLILLFLLFVSINCAEKKEETIETKKEIPKRIITTYQPASSLIFALRQEHKLVGINMMSNHTPLFCNLYNKYADLPGVGSRSRGVNLETVISLQADLVLLPPTVLGEETVKRLKKLNIKGITLSPESMEDMINTINELANILNCEAQADIIEIATQRIMQIIDNRLSNIEEHPNVYYATKRDFLSTCSGEILQHFMIERAGGENVSKDLIGFNVNISIEQLLLWNPDIIFISAGATYTPEDIYKNPLYSDLKAIKEHKIYKFPSNLSFWDYPSIEIFLATLWMAQYIYPESFKDIDFNQITDEFYLKIYNKSFRELEGKLE